MSDAMGPGNASGEDAGPRASALGQVVTYTYGGVVTRPHRQGSPKDATGPLRAPVTTYVYGRGPGKRP